MKVIKNVGQVDRILRVSCGLVLFGARVLGLLPLIVRPHLTHLLLALYPKSHKIQVPRLSLLRPESQFLTSRCPF